MTGSLKQRSEGSWSIIISLGKDPITGKRKQSWSTFRGNKKQAQAELTRLLNELNTGTFIEPAKLTVPEYLGHWVTEYAEVRVSPKTLERYRSIIDQHLKPAFANVPLTKLTPLHIQSHYSTALKEGRKDDRAGGLSAQTVLHHHRVLHEALAMAVKWQLLARNPADAVEPPKVVRKKVKPIDETESVWLMEAALGTRLYIPIMLAICAGLRRGEILPLKWTDYEPSLRRLWVRRALIETKADGVLIKDTKSERVRSITLPRMAIEALEIHRAEQGKRRELLADEYCSGDWVCCVEDGSLWHPSAFTSAYRALLMRRKLSGPNFHALRHSHASQMLRAGVDFKMISERLGHSKVAFTMDTYAHLFPGMDEEAARRIGDTLDAAFDQKHGLKDTKTAVSKRLAN